MTDRISGSKGPLVPRLGDEAPAKTEGVKKLSNEPAASFERVEASKLGQLLDASVKGSYGAPAGKLESKVESEIGSKIEDKLQPTSGGTIAGKLDSKLAEVAFKLQGIAAKLEGVAGKIEPQAGAGAGIDVEGMAFKLEDIAASLRGTAGKLHDPAHFIGTEKNLAGLPRLSPGAEALTVDGIAGEAERGVTPRGEGAPAAKVESKIELGGPQGLLPTGDEGESDG